MVPSMTLSARLFGLVAALLVMAGPVMACCLTEGGHADMASAAEAAPPCHGEAEHAPTDPAECPGCDACLTQASATANQTLKAAHERAPVVVALVPLPALAIRIPPVTSGFVRPPGTAPPAQTPLVLKQRLLL